MRAAVLTGFGGPDKLVLRDDVPIPVPAAGEVRIRVTACGINNTDIWTRVGAYGSSSGNNSPVGPKRTSIRFPRIQGADIVGVVDQPDPGSDGGALVRGSRVLVDPTIYPTGGSVMNSDFLGSDRDGGFAEFVVVPSANVHLIDSPLSDAELASFPVAYSTAIQMLDTVRLRAGERLVVTGATGGVGSALVQLGALAGAEVAAITRRSDATPWLRSLGAFSVSATAPSPGSMDVVADVVGGALLSPLLDSLRSGGRYVIAGAIGDYAGTLDLRTMYLNYLTLVGTSLATHENFRRLVSLIEAGRLRPLVDRVFPLEMLREAQAAFESKEFLGKLVMILE